MTGGFSLGVDRWLHRDDDDQADEYPLTHLFCVRHFRRYAITAALTTCPDCDQDEAEREQDRRQGAA